MRKIIIALILGSALVGTVQWATSWLSSERERVSTELELDVKGNVWRDK